MAKKKDSKKRVKASVNSIQKAKEVLSLSYHRQLSIITKAVIALVLALIGVGLYAPSYNYDFVYDDDAVVKNNRYVKSGTEGLGKIWTTSYFQGFNEKINARAFRPVPLTTLALELELLDQKPATAVEQLNWEPTPSIYHQTNLLYYGLTAAMLFFFLARLFSGYHYLLPIIITLLFVVHPIHLEVVANIKSRDTMLGFLNFVAAGWFLLKAVDTRKMTWLLPSIFFYFIALFSKEEVITFLAVIPLMLYFFREVSFKKIALYSAPFFFAVFVYLAIRTNIIGGLNAGVKLTVLDNSLLATNGFAERSASNLQSIGYYLLQAIFPSRLISDYSFSTLPNITWNTWQPYVALLANLGLLAAMFYGFLKRKMYSFGILFYFATVSIFTSLVITNVSVYNDRFLYTPVLGILIAVTWLLSKIMKLKNEDGDFILDIKTVLTKNILPLAIVLLLFGLSVYKVNEHLPNWTNRYTLFEHDLKISPNNARMLKNHGGSLSRLAIEQPSGSAERTKYATEGVEVLTRALDIYERIPTGWIHLANCQTFLGNYDEAEKAYRKALGIDAGNHSASVNLANIMYRKGKYQEALEILERIPKRNFKKGDYNLLSLTYRKLGDNGNADKYGALAK